MKMHPVPQNLIAETENLTLISRHSTYCLTHVIFQVENTLFTVPKYHFERNEVFATGFMLPSPPGEQPEGSSEEKPIKLEMVEKKDFEAFLRILHPLTIPVQYNEISGEDWRSVLKLSDMWNFDAIRELAIRELSTSDKLDPVSQILLGIKYNVGQWVIDGCTIFMTRLRGPKAEEAKLLGEEITTIIWNLREKSGWNLVNGMKATVAKAFADYSESVTF